jgi:hypothetical protein
MDRIRESADHTIRRGCGFAILAITMTMLGASQTPLLAIRVGAVFVTLMVVVLLLKAANAPRRPYRQTEAWILLRREHGLPEERAQGVIGQILRDRYLWHAQVAGYIATFMWAMGLLLWLAGRKA